MKKLRAVGLCLMGVMALLAVGCGKRGGSSAKTPANAGTFYWVQGLKGHPVHQMTQIAFREGCKKYGYQCQIIGTDSADLAGTIALAEQVLAKGDAKGMAIWTGSQAWYPLIEKAGRAKVPVILPHFPIPEGEARGTTGIIGCDPADYAREAAAEIGKAIGGKGTVAITQGGFNTTENMVSETFTKTMKELHPDVKVLRAELEGFDAAAAIAKAAFILQANPDVVAALSTTGGGPTTWAGAQKETGRKVIAVGMDYTRVNLDLVKNGKIYAVIGQPLWEESFGAVELLDKAVRGEQIPWWTKLPAPFLTKEKLAPYEELLKKVEAAIR